MIQTPEDAIKAAPVAAEAQPFREFISQPVAAAFCGGGVAGAVSRTVVSPLERLKILYQVQSAGRNEYKLPVGKALAKMWREEGWRGFMAGNGTNCIRIVPYSAVQFGSYNLYKKVRARIAAACSWGCRTANHMHNVALFREHSGSRSESSPKTPMWWYRRHYIGLFYISTGHCPYPFIHSIGIFCCIGQQQATGRKTARNVANSGSHV